MVQRIVNVEAKASLRSSTIIWDLDAHCFKGHCLFHITSSKLQTQDFNNKDSYHSKKLKLKDLNAALSCDNIVELAKKVDKKNKKIRFWGQRQEHIGERKKQTPATNVNVTKTAPKKKLKFKYFNYDKKGYYANNCT